MSDDHKLTIRIPKTDHHAARVKAVQEFTQLSEVIRRLLAMWVAGEVLLKPPNESEEPK